MFLNPSADKAVCMPQKIQGDFGLMPSSKKVPVTEKRVRLVNLYLGWFDKFSLPKRF